MSSTDGPAPGFDSELDAALKRVLEIIYREHPLEPNQILTLASELQRLGVHRLVEEHLRKFRRQEASSR
jgi:NAD-dependent oxidoreductase involved in siderophore biosynthesis